MLNPRLFLVRRRAHHAAHPEYIRSQHAKPAIPAEIYAYPAKTRKDAGWRQPKIPVAPHAPAPAPSLRWLPAGYGIVIMALWFVAANVTPGV